MAAELEGGDGSVEGSDLPQTPTEAQKQSFRRNVEYTKNPYSGKRDIIDNMLTYVNKDLLMCKIFYFFFFGAFGSLFPLLAVYFKQLGMNPVQGGMLIGFRPFVEFCSAPLWGGFADKWKKGKQLLLFSLFSWVAFTLAIAFVKPPAHMCLDKNSTHTILTEPYIRPKRETQPYQHGYDELVTAINIDPYLFNLPIENVDISAQFREKRAGKGMTPLRIDHTKIGNKNKDEVEGLVRPPFSTIVYLEKEVQEVFLLLLLLVVIGEFFSAPAITLADSVTLTYLGDDIDNYGRQRMFGSLGWGLAMFFVGMALDHSTTFPDHPCGTQDTGEKNYIVCFAVFSVLMSCAFVAATQLRFDCKSTQVIPLAELKEKMKDKIKHTFTGKTRIDRERLVEDDSDDDYGYRNGGIQSGHGREDYKQGSAIEDANKQNKGSLHINVQSRGDVVSDVVNTSHGDPEEPFMSKWIAVLKMLASAKYLSVLFVSWFMGFGVGFIFTFLFWHLQDIGGSPTLFGVASVINHISELFAYFLSAKFIASVGKSLHKARIFL